MKNSSLLTLVLLVIASMAFVAGVKEGVADVTQAAFLPIAIFATLAGYLLGQGQWEVRRAWALILLLGLGLIFVEASRLGEVLWRTVIYSPTFEFNALLSLIHKKTIDTSYLLSQFNEVISRTQIFFSELVKASTPKEPNLVLREVLWDLPILLLCAWSGWWTSRRNLILTAFAPSLALHALILNYTEKHALSLQVEAFAFIFLLGIHQNWNLNAHKKQEDVGKSRNDALATLFVLSFVIALFSGWAPVFSLQETAKKIAERQHINETLGLERKVAQSYTVTTSGLPREHLISAPPAQLLNIVFTASTGEQPVNDKEDVGTAPIPRRYWRWLTYDLYNGQNWLTSPIQSNSYAPNDSLFQFTGTGYEVIHQKINKSSTEDTR
ncbi:MAG: hypothetical protein U0Z26_17080 [Anaerolineales bacterium]